MKYEVVNIAQQYKEGNIDATEAMNTIVGIMFPDIYKDDEYIKKLVAFMWNVDPSIINNNSRTHPGIYAKIMYTKILMDKYKTSSTKLAEILRIRAGTIRARLLAHNKYMFGFIEYKKIYNLIIETI